MANAAGYSFETQIRKTTMPKQKTHKGMKKRFTVTAKGKAKCRSPFRGHLLSHKSGKRKRQNRCDTVLTGPNAAMIIEGLRPCS